MPQCTSSCLERRGPGQNEIHSRLLIHAARSNQLDLGQGYFQNPDVSVAAGLRTGEYFYEVSPGLPGRDHFGWVKAPGKTTTSFFTANSTTSRTSPGLVKNFAPASRQRRAVSLSSTVPAPTTISGRLLASWAITCIAPDCMAFYLSGPFMGYGTKMEPLLALGIAVLWAVYGGIYFMRTSKSRGRTTLIENRAQST